MRDIGIVACMPCAGDINPQAAKRFFAEMSDKLVSDGVSIYRIDPTPCSNLAWGFNRALCFALNKKREGKCTHFAMQHSDLEPSPYWLDTLYEEMERTGAHWIAAASPIKDCHGLTSTAISSGDSWNPWARLTTSELHALPETFCIDDLGPNAAELGYYLLLNTGCMLIDLRHDYWDTVGDRGELPLFFELKNRIVYNPATGWEAQTESEDWLLSRQMKDVGAKLFCTRKVTVNHYGTTYYTSDHPWGDWTRDQAGGRAAYEQYAKLQTGEVTGNVDCNIRSMNSFTDVVADTLKLAEILPPNISGILGVSRKGMLPASILASKLHLPLGSVDTFPEHGYFSSGKRKPLYEAEGPIVVIDDAVGSGTSLTEAVDSLYDRLPFWNFISAAVYVSDPMHVKVDYWAKQLPDDTLQESEFLNTFSARHFAVDLDGVLCERPVVCAENDDEECWNRWFDSVRPMYLPRLVPVKAIVTSRLEKYREVTEEWLRRWGVRYQELIMHPAKTANERDSDPSSHGIRKGQWFRDSDAVLFVESEPDQARQIVQVSNKLVFCTATKELLSPKNS